MSIIAYDWNGNQIEIGGGGGGEVELGAYANNLAGKYWLSVGDSITAQAWSYRVTIAQNFDANGLSELFAGGKQAGYGAGAGYSIYNDIKNMEIASFSHKPDIITILLGTNDYANSCPIGTIEDTGVQTADNYSFYGCYKGIIEKLHTIFGHVPTVLITPPKRAANNNTNSLGKTIKDYVDAIKEIGEAYSYPVVDLYSESGIPISKLGTSTFLTDDVHPTVVGWQNMSPKIYYAMNEAIKTLSVIE